MLAGVEVLWACLRAQFTGLHPGVLNKMTDYGGSNETKEEEEAELRDEEDDKMQPVSASKMFYSAHLSAVIRKQGEDLKLREINFTFGRRAHARGRDHAFK